MHQSTDSEIWKAHPQHSFIEVSTLGRVRSIAQRNERGWTLAARVRKLTVRADGYTSVQVGRRMIKTHVLVLETFVGPRPNDHESLHLDADRANSRLSNLRYGTRSENQLQRVADGNHYLANKTVCPRGHRLVEPNLRLQGVRQGKRQCLACHRGMQWVRRHPGADAQAACDRYYLIN